MLFISHTYIQKLVWYIRICSTRRTLRLCYRSTRLHIRRHCKVRQGPRHKHHCGNEHDEHSFREFHTSKNLSVRNRRTSSKGRANQTCFAPKGLEICSFCCKTALYRRPPVSAYGCILFRIFKSEFPNSEFPKPDSPQKAGDHGNPRRNAPLFLWGFLPPLPSVAFSLARSAKSVEPPRSLQGFLPIICRNHIVCPPSVLSGVGVALGTVYHTAPILSTISRHFQEFRRFSQIALIHFVQIALDYKCNLPCPPSSVLAPSAPRFRYDFRRVFAPYRGFCPLQFRRKLAILLIPSRYAPMTCHTARGCAFGGRGDAGLRKRIIIA